MDKLAEFLGGIKTEADSSWKLSSTDRQELERIVGECLLERGGEHTQLYINEVAKYCELVELITTTTRPVIHEQRLYLETCVKQLLELSLHVTQMEPEIQQKLRDETNLLMTLTTFIGERYIDSDMLLMLELVEVVSRDLKLNWCPPYFGALVKTVMKIMAQKEPTSQEFLVATEILCNLLVHNRNRVVLYQQDENFKPVFKKLLQLWTEKDNRSPATEVHVLAFHIAYLANDPVQKSNRFLHFVQETFLNLHKILLKDIEDNESAREHNVNLVSRTIYQVASATRTYLRVKNNDEWIKQVEYCSDEDLQHRNERFLQTMKTTINNIFVNFFNKYQNKLTLSMTQMLLDQLFPLLASFGFGENYLPDFLVKGLERDFTNKLNDLTKYVSKESRIQLVMLETWLKYADRFLNCDIDTNPAITFNTVLNECGLVISSSNAAIKKNVITIRLLNRLTVLINRYEEGNGGGSSVFNYLTKLKEEHILKLLDLLLSKAGSAATTTPTLVMSTCVMEVLLVTTKLCQSRHSAALMERFGYESTWIHIANMISNGNVEQISLGLALMGAVDFKEEWRAGVANYVLRLKENGSFPKELMMIKSPEKPSFPSNEAERGMATLNKNLEMLAQTNQKNPAIEDMITWHKLKTEVYEMEAHNLNEQILHLNRTVTHLKTLLNKQADLSAKRGVSTANMEKSFEDMKKELEITLKHKYTMEAKHMRAVEVLKGQAATAESLYETKTKEVAEVNEKLTAMEKIIDKLRDKEANMHERLENEKAEKLELEKKMEKNVKEQLVQKKKIATLEQDLKTTQTALKRVEADLEAEMQKTSIIQQVLGKANPKI